MTAAIKFSTCTRVAEETQRSSLLPDSRHKPNIDQERMLTQLRERESAPKADSNIAIAPKKDRDTFSSSTPADCPNTAAITASAAVPKPESSANTNSRTNATVVNDPLDNTDNIEVVQHSDTTLPIYEEDDVHNTSTWSMAPIRNLLGTFEDVNMNEEQLLLSPDDGVVKESNNSSPNGVDNFQEQASPKKGVAASRQPKKASTSLSNKIEIPHFEMYPDLQLILPQPVVDRCSFYSVIHGVNNEVKEMASQDQNCNTEEAIKDEGSALVRAVSGPTKPIAKREGPQIELAVLDEEKFLLAAIASRTDEEMMIRDCPASFAEAIGEVDSVSTNDVCYQNGHSENPLSVLANSRTQLWKPSRSWWEAKSGKNPWIEPKLHNKRWRYLWPLIHYHKFLAKCIKKLKRNNVDVKTSLSPVSAFLREEVCAVSDHLAAVSKFTSEEWMEGLPQFHGWTDSSVDSERKLRNIVATLPMRSLSEPADVESPLLRNQIDQSFLRAMAAAKEMMASGEEHNAGDSFSTGSMSTHRNPNISMDKRHLMNAGARPPRHSSKGSRPPKGINNRKSFNGKQRRHQMMNGYPGPHQMMPPGMMHHGMYASYDPYHGNHSNQYAPSHAEGEYYYNGWGQPMHTSVDYQDGSYHFDQSMDMSYYQPHDNSFTHPASGLWNPYGMPVVAGQGQGEEMSHCSDQASQIAEPEGVSLSFIGPQAGHQNGYRQNGTCQTPAKNDPRNGANPNAPHSPFWGHLNMATLAMSGLASPNAGGHPPSSPYDHQDALHGSAHGNAPNVAARPLLINGYGGLPTHGVPPSPATQFCSQVNPQSQAYWLAQTNPMHAYPSNQAHNNNTSFAPVEKPKSTGSTGSATTQSSSSTEQESKTS